MKRTDYEWVTETKDEYGDIVDADYSDKFPGFAEAENVDVALVYRLAEGPDEQGLDEVDRGYAYIVEGELPAEFDNGVKVPKRYHKLIARKSGVPETGPTKDAGDYMSCPRPRGAPKIGTRIHELLDGGEKSQPLTVTDYLATQFLAEDDAGNVRVIIASNINWEAAA